MTRRQAYFWQFLLYGGVIFYTLFMIQQMPDRVPVHWGISGKPDRWGSKWEQAIITPIVACLMLGLTAMVPRILKPEQRNDVNEGSLYLVLVMVAGLMSTIQVAIIQAAMGQAFDISRAMMCIMFLFFAGFGNVMGRVRQNPYIGIRTTWTLKDERVWEETHRRAAYVWFVGGIIGCAGSALGVPFVISFLFMMAFTLHGLLDSYLIWKRLHPNG